MKYGYGEVKNVLSEVKLRKKKKAATEKKKARGQQLENEEENSFCFVSFSLSNNCVFCLAQGSSFRTELYKKNLITITII